jgi:hypothetical protein
MPTKPGIAFLGTDGRWRYLLDQWPRGRTDDRPAPARRHRRPNARSSAKLGAVRAARAAAIAWSPKVLSNASPNGRKPRRFFLDQGFLQMREHVDRRIGVGGRSPRPSVCKASLVPEGSKQIRGYLYKDGGLDQVRSVDRGRPSTPHPMTGACHRRPIEAR